MTVDITKLFAGLRSIAAPGSTHLDVRLTRQDIVALLEHVDAMSHAGGRVAVMLAITAEHFNIEDDSELTLTMEDGTEEHITFGAAFDAWSAAVRSAA